MTKRTFIKRITSLHHRRLAAASIATDTSLLRQSVDHISKVITLLETLAPGAPWSELGYFDASRHDEIEHLFFRFLASQRVLVSLALREGWARLVLLLPTRTLPMIMMPVEEKKTVEVSTVMSDGDE